jgi:Na+/H+ antiporter NhaD/arsenite permease-like protein
MELNPVPVLMATVIYSNIGGSITPVGDPPNVIIASNQDVIDSVRIITLLLASSVPISQTFVLLHKREIHYVIKPIQVTIAITCRALTPCMNVGYVACRETE